MKILVTGGAGYVGCRLVKALLDIGHNVRVVDNFSRGNRHTLALFASYSNLSIFNNDVTGNIPNEAFENVDSVIHLAALVGYPACKKNPIVAWETNTDAVREIILKTPNAHHILASTNSVYSNVEKICDENSETLPETVYGRTKRWAELEVLKVGGTVLRFATIFGPSYINRTDSLMHDMFIGAIERGFLQIYEPKATRAFVHIDDAINAYLHIIHNPKTTLGSWFNIGNLHVTKEELAAEIKKRTSCELEFITSKQDPEKRDYYFDCNLFCDATKFQYTHKKIDFDSVFKMCKALADT